MFKRRLAVLGAVCAVALTGLAGSALADEPVSPAGAKVTCTTSDGKTIELAAPEPGKPTGIVVGPDGKVKQVDPDELVKIEAIPAKPAEGGEPSTSVRVDKLPTAVQADELPPGLQHGEVVTAEPAKPAKPAEGFPEVGAEPAEGDHATAVTIVCKKPE